MHTLDGSAGAPASRASASEVGELRLMHRIARSDRSAFEAMYRSYFPRLTRFLYRMTRNLELIEELVNDTMLVVWRKAGTFDASCKVSTWVFAIAYRTACKAIAGLDEPVEDEPDLAEAAPACQPDWQCEALRRQQAVAAAIEALPPAQRTVVQLTYFHDMGYAEIAAVMDCPENTVKTRMFHARRRLAQLLANQLEVET
jgi:RNA polymerase sigma-70 factor (ECF subfamily)